ncbi:MAG: hypothetical protein ACOC1K_05300 [Nanoarchaeota archaeon]
MKVSNIKNSSGKPVKNQFIIEDDNGNTFFQSYKSMIAKKTPEGEIFLDERYYNYSSTTSKYRNMFLGEDTKTIEKKIKSGEYKLANLNK